MDILVLFIIIIAIIIIALTFMLMPTKKAYIVKCPHCYSSLVHIEGSVYVCDNCGEIF